MLNAYLKEENMSSICLKLLLVFNVVYKLYIHLGYTIFEWKQKHYKHQSYATHLHTQCVTHKFWDGMHVVTMEMYGN